MCFDPVGSVRREIFQKMDGNVAEVMDLSDSACPKPAVHSSFFVFPSRCMRIMNKLLIASLGKLNMS